MSREEKEIMDLRGNQANSFFSNHSLFKTAFQRDCKVGMFLGRLQPRVSCFVTVKMMRYSLNNTSVGKI